MAIHKGIEGHIRQSTGRMETCWATSKRYGTISSVPPAVCHGEKVKKPRSERFKHEKGNKAVFSAINPSEPTTKWSRCNSGEEIKELENVLRTVLRGKKTRGTFMKARETESFQLIFIVTVT